MVKSCCICKTAGSDSKSYYRIPKAVRHRNQKVAALALERRQKWCEILNIPLASPGKRVCSIHFVKGSPAQLFDTANLDWLPTLNLTKSTVRTQQPSNEENTTLKKRKKISNAHDLIRQTKLNSLVCRLCAQVMLKNISLDIFKDKHLLEKISSIIPIQVGDSLPKTVCKPCVRKVELCVEWIEGFKEADKVLKEEVLQTEQSNQPSKDKLDTLEHLDDRESSAEGVSALKEEVDSIKEVEYDSKPSSCNSSSGEDDVDDASGKNEDAGPSGKYIYNEGGAWTEQDIRDFMTSQPVDTSSDSDSQQPPVKRRAYRPADPSHLLLTEERSLTCGRCYRVFTELEELREHKAGCPLFFCRLCKPRTSFVDVAELARHKAACHAEPMVCHVCGGRYAQSYMDKHFRNHFAAARSCGSCGKWFRSAERLVIHLDRVHEGRRSELCEVCGGRFKDLHRHVIKHSQKAQMRPVELNQQQQQIVPDG